MLFGFDLINLSHRGTDTVSVGFWVGDCCNGSAEKRVTLQLSLLSTPSELVWIPAASNMRCVLSPLFRPGHTRKVCQLSTKPRSLTGHHLGRQQVNDDMLSCSRSDMSRGPERTMEADIIFAYVHTDSTFTMYYFYVYPQPAV